jgi:hypothetical protein
MIEDDISKKKVHVSKYKMPKGKVRRTKYKILLLTLGHSLLLYGISLNKLLFRKAGSFSSLIIHHSLFTIHLYKLILKLKNP